jgi:hypothetical protein
VVSRPGESAGVLGVLLVAVGVEEPDQHLPCPLVAQQQLADPESGVVAAIEQNGDRQRGVVGHR